MAALKKKKFDNVINLEADKILWQMHFTHVKISLLCYCHVLTTILYFSSKLSIIPVTSYEQTKQKSDAQDEYEFEVRSDSKPNGAPIAGADGVDGVDQKKDGKAPVEAVRQY